MSLVRFPNLPNLLERCAKLGGILLLLGAILAGSLDGWRDYDELGDTAAGFNVATMSSEAVAAGDIEPALFPGIRPASVALQLGQPFVSGDPRPVRAVFVPHDRPPAFS